jgi:hypothetical protein
MNRSKLIFAGADSRLDDGTLRNSEEKVKMIIILKT